MSMNPFFGNLEKQINKSIERALSNTSTSFTNPMAGASVDSSVFLGADLETFKNIVDEGVNSNSQDSVFYGQIESAGVKDMFESIDKNGDGVIDEDELRKAAMSDGNVDNLSVLDLKGIINSMPYSNILKNLKSQIAAAASKNTSGSSGLYSPGMSGNQTTQGKLDNLESQEIPELEQQKQEIIDKAQQEIDAKKQESDSLIQQNQEKLNELGEQYSAKQDEINECDNKISEYTTKITEAKSEKHGYEGTLSNLEGELSTLSTNTGDEEKDAANAQRKSEIESQIQELKEKIAQLEEQIEEYETQKQEQINLKAQKQEELQAIQDEIDKQEPMLSEQLQTIQDEIKEIETQRDEQVSAIDTEIEAKRNEALGYQKELGERTGQLQSSSLGAYNKEMGEMLAENALDVAGTTGWCLRGVNNSLEDTYGQRLSFNAAYQAIPALQGKVAGYEDLAAKFQEVEVSRDELSSLPAGAIVVWDRSEGHEYGHISIALGDGRESSDHITTQMTNRDAEYHVFIPV